MAAGRTHGRKPPKTEPSGAEHHASYDLRLVPLPVSVARLMLAGRLRAARPANLGSRRGPGP